MKCPISTCIWPTAIKEIDGPIALQQLRGGFVNDKIVPFTFCPWCGAALVGDDEPETIQVTEPKSKPTAVERLLKRLTDSRCVSAHWSTIAILEPEKFFANEPTPSPRYENGELHDVTEEMAEEIMRIYDAPDVPDPEILGDSP